MSNPIFRIEGVSKSFGKNLILDNISLDILSGEIIGIIGASGSGKTTLLNTIVGFLKPDSGDVKFRLNHLLSYKENYVYNSVYKRQNLVKKIYGFASQVPSFYEELTVKENLEYFGSLHNLDRETIRSNMTTLISLMGLDNAKQSKGKNLSGGMERRLDIACSLMHDPEILILDEPTADLDPLLRNQIWELLRMINKKGTTIILSSHHLTELETLCDRVAIVKDGKLLAEGKPSELKKEYNLDKEIIVQTSPGNYDELRIALYKKQITKITINKNMMHILTKNPEKTLLDVLLIIKKRKEKLNFIKVSGASLDDVFISLWDKKKK